MVCEGKGDKLIHHAKACVGKRAFILNESCRSFEGQKAIQREIAQERPAGLVSCQSQSRAGQVKRPQIPGC